MIRFVWLLNRRCSAVGTRASRATSWAVTTVALGKRLTRSGRWGWRLGGASGERVNETC